MTLSRRRLRIWADPLLLEKGEALRDFEAACVPRLINGNALDLETAVFKALALADLSEVDSLVATFKSSQNVNATALASKEVDAVDFNDDDDFDVGDFKDGDAGAYHALFQFSDAEMSWDLDGAKEMSAWLVITAMLADGSERTLAMGEVIMVQDNNSIVGGILPASFFTVTNNELQVLCPDGTVRTVALLNP